MRAREVTLARVMSGGTSGSVTRDFRVVLTRAFCMKARRDVPTEKKATLDEAWPDGESMDVPFMRRRERLLAGIAWSIGAEAVICEIRYAGGRLAMVLIVPSARWAAGFAWAVVQTGTGTVLFAGTVTDPR